jgi:hypothetical protein
METGTPRPARAGAGARRKVRPGRDGALADGRARAPLGQLVEASAGGVGPRPSEAIINDIAFISYVARTMIPDGSIPPRHPAQLTRGPGTRITHQESEEIRHKRVMTASQASA